MALKKGKIQKTIKCSYDELINLATGLKEAGASLVSISANITKSKEIRINYFFEQDSKLKIIKTITKDKTAYSLLSYFSNADFVEREINKRFGVKFLGHPNLPRER